MNSKVDKYLDNLNKWQKELTKLRNLITDCGLTEEYKWMHPCYTYKGVNIVLIHEFKDYCAILFHKGALLNDSKNILVQQTENTQSARQIRFSDISKIEDLKSTIKEYIYEAIEVEKAGLKVKKKKTSDFEIVEELKLKFKENSDFENAFKNLTEGRQRGYLLHFYQPKQAKTRISRIKKNTERIFEGYGLNDCTCGLSKRKPNCDGSHKQLKK
tara:strand:+ start:88 stop:729 length:642 start_codon:yes stop_codon:yes gene_type:complete